MRNLRGSATWGGSRLPIRTLRAGSQTYRVHLVQDGAVPPLIPDPGSRPVHRFDAPAGEYRTVYLGDSPEVAVAETIIRQSQLRYVPRQRLAKRCIARIPIVRDLRLVRFHGPGLVRLGVGAEEAHGYPYTTCQEYALAFWSHPGVPDGIEYRSRWDNDRLCYMLFDRAADALGTPSAGQNLDDPLVFTPILRRYGMGVG